jgi:segregation and condensation protein A
MNDYTVFLEKIFRGPMDLLLHLVREQEVEIHEVEITRVIRGYTEYLSALQELDIELAGDFTVMAATLMAIKSRSLLPQEEINLEDELDPKDELIQRLLEYRRFKEASDSLAKGLDTRQKLYPRGAFPELAEERAADEPTLDLGDLSSWDLLSTFSRLMRETLANQPMRVLGDARPMRFYVSTLAQTMRRAGRLSLYDLVKSIDGQLTKDSLVGSFCALLELIKIGIVIAAQGDEGGEIDIVFAEESSDDLDNLLDGTTFDDELDPDLLDSNESSSDVEPQTGEVQASEPLVEASEAPLQLTPDKSPKTGVDD